MDRSNISYNNDSLEQPSKSSKMVLIEDLLEDEGVEREERVIRGLKSDRLFFEPGGETNSILEEQVKKTSNSNGYCSNVELSVTLKSIESLDPYLDFKKSMEEMVDANNGVKDWDWLQELLGCYLKVNEKRHHEFIIGAFVDLLLGLELEGLEWINCSSFVASSSSPMRFSSSDISISFTSNSTSNLPNDEVSFSS